MAYVNYMATPPLSVDDFTFDLQRFDDNITWEIVDGVLTVSGTGSISSSPWYWNGRESITSIVVNEGITYIGDYAFSSCTNLTSVSLPSTVTEIAPGTAFYGITFPDNFSATIAMPSGKMITYAYGSYKIFADENGIADITTIVKESRTFSFADLPSGTCGDNLTWAFDGHKLTISGTGAMSDFGSTVSPWNDYRDEITTVEIGDGVTSIGKKAFYTCQNLSSVTIPAALETIGDSAFYNCTRLPATLDLSGTKLTTIDGEAFSGCTSLERVILPDTVTSIGWNAFRNCADGLSVVIAVLDDEKVTMGNTTLTPTNGYVDITSLVGNYSAISYSIGGTCGDNLTWTFDGGKLTISGNGEMNYSGEPPWKNRLAQITSVEIGSGVTKIIGGAFSGCENLQSVTVAVPSNKILTINDTEYTPSSGTVNITSLVADDLTISSIYGGTDGNITWRLTDDGMLTISGTGSIDHFPWQSYNDRIKAAVIGEGFTLISGRAFYGGYSNLTSVTLPEGTTAIVGYELLNGGENFLDYLKNSGYSVALTTAAASEVTYTDVNGESQTVLAFTLGNDSNTIDNGTYFVTGTVNLESLTINGDARIILGDGAKLNVSGTISTEDNLLICGGGEVTAESFSAASVTFDRNFADGTNLYKSGTAYSNFSAGGTFTPFDAYELDIQLDGATISCADDDKITLGDKIYYKVGAAITITIPDGEKLLIDGEEVSGTVNYTMPAQDTLLTEPPSLGELKTDSDGNEYYSVTKAIHLVTLAEQVNGGETFSGVTFKLEKDINLSKIENFTPIGFAEDDSYAYYFSGTFDGGDYKISGLTINLPDNDCVGLFGYVNGGGTVKNVTLENVNVTGGSWGVGALVGYNESGTIENCSVIGGTVSGEDGVGGLVGENDDCIISGCTAGNVTVTAPHEYAWVGGLVGDNYGTVSENSFSGSVIGTSYGGLKGGLVGNNSKGTISGNTVDAQITVGEYSWVGGLVGDNYGGTVSGNTVFSEITAGNDSYVGGVVGCDEYNSSNSSTVKNNFFHSTADNAIGGYFDYDGSGADISDNERLFALELPEGVVATGDGLKTVNEKLYAAGEVTLTATTQFKTGYALSTGETFTINADTTVTLIPNPANHYVLASDTNTLATATNTTDYPDLTQVYELTLPSGVTASGEICVTDGGKTYATGSVNLKSETAGYTTTVTVDADNTDFTNIIKFNKTGTSVEVDGTFGDFSANSGVYSITASQENSTFVANAKNNTVIIVGGGENILTGGQGNDTYKFTSGGGIVTDFGIGVTKSGDGKTLSAPSGVDVVKVSGKVTGIYFDRDASNKKSATFTAVVTYDSDGDSTADEIIVLRDIAKKPTKTSSDPAKVVYQTGDVAAATLKIWDTSGSKQAVLSATKLKKLFRDDEALTDDLSADLQTQLVKLNGIGDLHLPAIDQLSAPPITYSGYDNG